MTYDLAVIGQGFWGTATARLARAAGASVLTIDDGNPLGASRNAAGIIQESWFRQETISKMITGVFSRADVHYGIDWLSENAGLKQTGEDFTSYQNLTRRFRKDVYIAPSVDVLLDLPTVKASVDWIRQIDEDWDIITKEETYCARRVVLATGWWTDDLLDQSGFITLGIAPLIGRALIAKTQIYNTEVPYTHLPRPYKHLTVRSYQGAYRIGDTTENISRLRDDSSYEYLRGSFEKMTGEEPLEIKRLCGIRPVCEQMIVRKVAPNMVVSSGGHRVGLALAPSAAQKSLRLLGLL